MIEHSEQQRIQVQIPTSIYYIMYKYWLLKLTKYKFVPIS